MKYYITACLTISLLILNSCRRENPEPVPVPSKNPVAAPDTFYILRFDQQDSLVIQDSRLYNWSVKTDSQLLTADPSSGVSTGSRFPYTILRAVNPENGDFTTSITISVNGTDKKVVVVYSAEKQARTFLPEPEISDIAFDQENSIMYFVSDKSTMLHRYNLKTRTFDKLSVNHPSGCIGISPDKKHAALGHDGKVSFVNLSSFTYEKTVETAFNAYDIALNNNRIAYVSPSVINGIYGISMDQSIFFAYGHLKSFSSQTKFRWNNKGDYVYLASTQGSNNTIDKMRLNNDTPYFVSRANTGIIYDIIISEDDKLLFDTYGGVFNAETMKMIGEHKFGKGVPRSVAHNPINKTTHFVMRSFNNSIFPQVQTYGYSDYSFQTVYEIPSYRHVPRVSYGMQLDLEADPHYLFYDPSGKETLLISRLTNTTEQAETPIKYKWTLQRIR